MNPPLFVALTADIWVNTNDIRSIEQNIHEPNSCTVLMRGDARYFVRCSARDFLKRIDEART